jgi:16S rRNA (cytidine1402-2'-O)-methyltransferase
VAATLHLLPVPLQEGDPARSLPRGTIEAMRALRIFLAENAKSARAHLKAVAHPVALSQLHIVEIGHQPDPRNFDSWLAPLLGRHGHAPEDMGLLSEAGCPTIADPGAGIVARAQELGARVLPWSGPCSAVLALMASGIPAQRFRFLGYLPRDAAELARRIHEIERDALAGEAQVFIETPYRNERLLEALLRACAPATRLCVAAGLTGDGEQVRTLTVARWRELSLPQRPSLSKRPAIFVLGA